MTPRPNRVATTGDPDAFRSVAIRLFGDTLPVVEGLDLAAARRPAPTRLPA